MKYLYVASTRDGRQERGSIEARNAGAAAELIRHMGLMVVSVHRDTGAMVSNLLGIGWVNNVTKVAFTKHLSLMIRAGLPIDESLRILRDQAIGRFRKVLTDAATAVESGRALSDALAQHPKVFSNLYVATIRAGELSGTMEGSFEDLAVQLTKNYDLNRKIRGAMIYPILVITAALGIGLGLSVFVLPKVIKLFESISVGLPLSTRLLMGASRFLADHGLVFFLALGGGIIGIWNLFQLPALKPLSHGTLLKLPIFGKLAQNYNLATFSRTMATLLKSGIAIGEAFKITSDTIRNVLYKKALLRVRETIETGAPSSGVLEEYPKLFTSTTTRMIAVGERTGKLEDTFGYLSDFYEDEVDSTTKNLSTILEPVLLMGIGLAVAFIAIAVILPIYNFIGSIEKL